MGRFWLDQKQLVGGQSRSWTRDVSASEAEQQIRRCYVIERSRDVTLQLGWEKSEKEGEKMQRRFHNRFKTGLYKFKNLKSFKSLNIYI